MDTFTRIQLYKDANIAVRDGTIDVTVEIAGARSCVSFVMSKEQASKLRHQLMQVHTIRASPEGIQRLSFFADQERRLKTGTELHKVMIDELELPTRVLNCLRYALNLRTVEDLLRHDEPLIAECNFGRKSLRELIQYLDAYGLKLHPKAAAA
jgi:DNA-directed RNA polymerase alpha subunit